MSDLDRSMHISLLVYVTHSLFIEGLHMTKNAASGVYVTTFFLHLICLLTNIRPTLWNHHGTNAIAYFAKMSVTKKKKFHKIDTRCLCFDIFSSSHMLDILDLPYRTGLRPTL